MEGGGDWNGASIGALLLTGHREIREANGDATIRRGASGGGGGSSSSSKRE